MHAGSEALVEPFTRFAASRGKNAHLFGRARVFTVTSAKGGAGATTVAVNTAIALQESQGGVLLVDFCSAGPCCSSFECSANVWHRRRIAELDRMDSSLLDGLMTQCKGACNSWLVRNNPTH